MTKEVLADPSIRHRGPEAIIPVPPRGLAKRLSLPIHCDIIGKF